MARKTKEQIGAQTMRMLIADSNTGGSRRNMILKANARALLPIYAREGNRDAVKAMRARLGAVSG